MVKVCDAIMGSGKSQSAIRYMDTHPDQRFIYISPYKTDGTIIQSACEERNFAIPANMPDFNYSKTEHCRALIASGRNIACTHELFKRYDTEILQTIRDLQYTLIIDEEVNVMEDVDLHEEDYAAMEQGCYIRREDDEIILTEKGEQYGGNYWRDLFKTLSLRKLYCNTCDDGEKYFYWQLPPDLINAFVDVYILTYMFDCQDIRYMFDLNGIQYENIYIRRTDGGGYEFCDKPSYLPEYVCRLSAMIDIYEGKYNDVGTPTDGRECPLSQGWFKRPNNKAKVERVRSNLRNYFTTGGRSSNSDERMWSTYADDAIRPKLSYKGYAQGFLSFNKRGSNEYRHKTWLAYCVNLYMNPQKKNYYAKYGITPAEDEWALSTMIQWIWRSAIRDGKPIHIYIPSERMRNLLKDWIALVEADAVSGRWAQHGQEFEGDMSPTEAIAS